MRSKFNDFLTKRNKNLFNVIFKQFFNLKFSWYIYNYCSYIESYLQVDNVTIGVSNYVN